MSAIVLEKLEHKNPFLRYVRAFHFSNIYTVDLMYEESVCGLGVRYRTEQRIVYQSKTANFKLISVLLLVQHVNRTPRRKVVRCGVSPRFQDEGCSLSASPMFVSWRAFHTLKLLLRKL